MNNSPQVSIITPSYNHEKFIGACIESAIQQTYENWEQIIIDDGSTDQTAEVILSYADPRIRYVHQENRGIEALPHTYNRALEFCNGELIAILEGDDAWPPEKLSSLVKAFDDKDVVLAYGARLHVESGRSGPRASIHGCHSAYRTEGHWRVSIRSEPLCHGLPDVCDSESGWKVPLHARGHGIPQAASRLGHVSQREADIDRGTSVRLQISRGA